MAPLSRSEKAPACHFCSHAANHTVSGLFSMVSTGSHFSSEQNSTGKDIVSLHFATVKGASVELTRGIAVYFGGRQGKIAS